MARPRGPARAGGSSFRLANHSGYASADLRRFLARGFAATGTPTRGLVVYVWSAPGRSKGCAEIGGRRMDLALAPPSRASLRRLARVVEHECAHLRGFTHERMSPRLLYSRGPTPAWARGARIRYLGRAPRQLPLLARERRTRR